MPVLIEKDSHQEFRLFLTYEDREQLERLAVQEVGWRPGRQGSGYFKLDIKEYTTYDTLPWLKILMGRVRGELEIEPGEDWDAWLLYYPEGSFIPEHVDPVPAGFRMHRFNAVIENPISGGEFFIDDEEVSLTEGDAVLFQPSWTWHSVEEIEVGRRLVFSVGVLKKYEIIG